MAQVITLRNIYNSSGVNLTPAYAVATNGNSDSIVSQGTGIYSYKKTTSMNNFPVGITLKGLVNIGDYAYGVSGNILYRFIVSLSTIPPYTTSFTYEVSWDMTDNAYTSNFPFVNGSSIIQNANTTNPISSNTFSEPLQINSGGTNLDVTGTTPAVGDTTYTVITIFGTTSYLTTDLTNIYALLPDNRIAKITLVSSAPSSISLVRSQPVPVLKQDQTSLTYGLTYLNGYLYTFNGLSSTLTYVNINTGAIGDVTLTGGTTTIQTAPGGSVSAYYDGTYYFLFVAKYISGSYYQIDVLQMNTSDLTKYNYSTENRFSFQEVPINTTISGNTLYTLSTNTNATGTYYNVYQLQIGVANIPICFLKGTYIYTNEGYKLIETLKKGDLVNTFKDNYVRIDTIVEEELIHDAEKERNSRQLFKLSYPEYPKLLKDLYITGAHSILVGKLTEKQEKQIIKDYGRTFATDLFDRLPAYIDEKAKVHEESGTYTIYHLCLENENKYSNYGIFANGLLVESLSKNDCVNRIY